MGLFDAFRGASSVPGIYAPWMTYDAGAPDITPSAAMVPAGPLDTSAQSLPALPKSGGISGLLAMLNSPDQSTGMSPLDQIGRLGASFQDMGQPGSNGANLTATDQALNAPVARQMAQLNMQAARQKMAMLQNAFGLMNGDGQAPQAGAAPPSVPMYPGMGGGAGGQVPMAAAPGGAPPSATFQQAAVPVLPGARPSPLTGQMRKGLAMMALVDGHPDQAATILDDRKKITAGSDGWLYDQDTGEVIGRLPNHQVVNGYNVDLGASDAPSYIPKLPDGTIPDGRGGVINIPGLASASQEQARAQAYGTAEGQAPFQIHALPGAGPGGGPLYGTTAGLVGPGGPLGGRTIAGQAPGDTTYANDTAKNAVSQYQGIQTAGQQALTNIPKYQRLGELLDGYNGNKLSAAGVDLAQFARGLPGLQNFDAKLPNKEAALAITNQLALSLRDPSQGGGMPGSLSNSDRDFLVRSVPNLAQTAQGRRMMVDAAIKLNQRNADVAAKARAWQQRFGRIDAPDATGKTFFDYLQAYADSHPLFGAAQ